MDVATDQGVFTLMSNTSTPTTERLWQGWHSVERQAVWTSSVMPKEGARAAGVEKLWANLPLVQMLNLSQIHGEQVAPAALGEEDLAALLAASADAAQRSRLRERASDFEDAGDRETAEILREMLDRLEPDALHSRAARA